MSSKFNIDTKIDINFSEDQIKAILVEVITAEMPSITVDEINFVVKRNPTNISASIDASMTGFESTAEATPKVAKVTAEIDEEEEEEVKESVSDFLDLDSQFEGRDSNNIDYAWANSFYCRSHSNIFEFFCFGSSSYTRTTCYSRIPTSRRK